jgi:hypothetical protein
MSELQKKARIVSSVRVSEQTDPGGGARPLQSIPDEVADVMISNLSQAELASLAQTDKRFYQLANQETKRRKAKFLEKIATSTATADDCVDAIQMTGNKLDTDMSIDLILAALGKVCNNSDSPLLCVRMLQVAARKHEPVREIVDKLTWPLYLLRRRVCYRIANCATVGKADTNEVLIVITVPGMEPMAIWFRHISVNDDSPHDMLASCMACKSKNISFNWRTAEHHMTQLCWRDGSVVSEFDNPYFEYEEETLTLKYTTGLAYFLYALLFTPSPATQSTRGGDEGSKRKNDDDDDGGGGGGAKRSTNSGLSFTDLAI